MASRLSATFALAVYVSQVAVSESLAVPASVDVSSTLLKPVSILQPDTELFPPAGLDPPRDHVPKYTAITGPKQTNKFWESWGVDSPEKPVERYAIFVAPFTLKWLAKGTSKVGELVVSHNQQVYNYGSGVGTDAGRDHIKVFTTPFKREFSLGAVEELSEYHQIVKETLFGAHFEVEGKTDAAKKITYPIFQGMAFVSARYEGGLTPTVSADSITSVTQASDGIWNFVNSYGSTFRVWALTPQGGPVDSSYQFDANGQLNKPLDGWLRIAQLLGSDDASAFDAAAGSILVDWELEVMALGQIKYTFKMQEGAANPSTFVHFAWAHHLPLLADMPKPNAAPSLAPSKGKMTLVQGNVWDMKVDTTGAEGITWLPKGEELDAEMQASILAEAKTDLQLWEDNETWREVLFRPPNENGDDSASYYWSGKGFQKVGTVCLILAELDGSDSDDLERCLDILEAGFECMYLPGQDCLNAPAGSYYDEAWGGIPSKTGFYPGGRPCYELDFGHACYNDHHYQFGYWIVSAAIITSLRPEFKENTAFVDWINMMIRDTTNPSTEDPWFPQFRSFDWFDFHSWSRGIMPDPNGKDQESTSEDVNLFYGLILWSRTMGNADLEALATTMLACDVTAIKEYFLMKTGNPNYHSDFVKNHVTGIFFQNTVDYQTWFGNNAEYIHGIQMLPLSPALQLTRDAEFSKQEWEDVLSKVPEDQEYRWTSLLITGNLAVWQREEAMRLLTSRTRESLDDGLTMSLSMYWIAKQAPEASTLLKPVSQDQPDSVLFPGAGLDPPREYMPTFTDVKGPKQTNKFWESWGVDATVKPVENYAIFVMPWTMKWLPVGTSKVGQLAISHAEQNFTYGNGNNAPEENIVKFTTMFTQDISIGASATLREHHSIVKETLFGVHIEVRAESDFSKKITYPIFQGMAYVSALYEGGLTPCLYADEITEITKVTRGIWKFVNGNGAEYRIYVLSPTGEPFTSDSEFDLSGSDKICLNTELHGWLRIAQVLSPGDAEVFDRHSGAVLCDMNLDLTAVGKFRYNFGVQPGAPDPANLIHFAWTHHLPLLPNNLKPSASTSHAPTKGKMTLVQGNVWDMTVDTSAAQALSWLPTGQTLTDDEKKQVADEAKKDLDLFEADAQWRVEMFKNSYYWSGKGFQKVGTVCLILRELLGVEEEHTQRCAALLETGFKCMYTDREGLDCTDAPKGSYYDLSWGGIPSREGFYRGDVPCWEVDFGHGCYNDHHYQFGYFVAAGAILADLRPEYKQNKAFVDWINMLIRDTTNPSTFDTWFPNFRSFDWFDFHSWSRGVVPDPNGKDQESTSEDVNLFYGMLMWARTLGNTDLENLAATMLTLDVIAIKEYFLMKTGNPHYNADFVKNHVTGIFFQNTVDYRTWFGSNPEYIHGIQMLPLSPALQMARDVEFCKQEWDDILYQVPEDQEYRWTSLLQTGNLAVWARDTALRLLTSRTRDSLDDGLTMSLALYWTMVQQTGESPVIAPPGTNPLVTMLLVAAFLFVIGGIAVCSCATRKPRSASVGLTTEIIDLS